MSENELTAVTVETSLVQPKPRDGPHGATNHGLRNICKDTDHRKLAICSIICGLSCLGIMSLMYSVKVIIQYYWNVIDVPLYYSTNIVISITNLYAKFYLQLYLVTHPCKSERKIRECRKTHKMCNENKLFKWLS